MSAQSQFRHFMRPSVYRFAQHFVLIFELKFRTPVTPVLEKNLC